MPNLNDREMGALERISSSLLTLAETTRITSDAEFQKAGEFLLKIKEAKKRVKDVLDPFVRDQHDAWKRAVERRKKYEEPLDKAEAIIKPMLSQYQERKEREEILALEAQAQAAESGDMEAALSMPVPSGEAPKVDGLTFREHWQFEVQDPNAVPREFLKPDDEKIGRMVRAMRGETRIPGVRVWSTRIPVGRT